MSSRPAGRSYRPRSFKRKRAKNKTLPRSLRVEQLENRHLLAVGPQLIGIQPNSGELLETGQTRNIAPQELLFRFNDGQRIDASTLATGIQITRSGFDGVLGDGDDVQIIPGYAGLTDQSNEVIVRFAEPLPDDIYRIELVGAGVSPLRNVDGDRFNDGVNVEVDFELDLGAKILAVVPQPVTRDATTGDLSQARDQIVIYFNDDDLRDDATSAENTDFYQLIFTNDTLTNQDDVIHNPESVAYDPSTDTAVLTFASNLDELSTGPGTYRLRVGTSDALPPTPDLIDVAIDPGSSFDTAHDLGTVGVTSQILSSEIEPQAFDIVLPGARDEPGHRETDVQNHIEGDPDTTGGSTTIEYNFREIYGLDPLGNPLFNLITENQKERAREVFDLFAEYAGVQVVETDFGGIIVATGDLRAITPGIDTGFGGTESLSGQTAFGQATILDSGELWNDTFGADWFRTAYDELTRSLGLGFTTELDFDEADTERVLPTSDDIIHLQNLYRPDSIDIDMYRFEVAEAGQFTAEIFAERNEDSSLLDALITVYREDETGAREVIARNDDYYSKDSFLQLNLEAGTYYIGVSASGNDQYDPTIENTGFGGRTNGDYDLIVHHRVVDTSGIVDETGIAFDGDANGVAGGQFNFWFRTAAPEGVASANQPRTIFVDKVAADGGDGSLASPFNTIDAATNDAQAGDIVRILSNGSLDDIGNISAYELGFNTSLAIPTELSDGANLAVPQGVTVMIDAGSVLKLRDTTIEVGSFAPTIDLSRAGLQVLGTPDTNVIFTSYDDEATGIDTNPIATTAEPGQWGGIVFRNDLDRAENRFDYEAQGIFLNHVNQATMMYGGGQFARDSVDQFVAPVQMIDARPTVSYNTITMNAGAAFSANPDSFEESNFQMSEFVGTPFSLDYGRVGPDFAGNRIFNNTINGLFIRTETPAGNELDRLQVSGRWDDTEVVHIVAENLIIDSNPGGPVSNELTGNLDSRLDASLVVDPGIVVKLDGSRIEAAFGARFVAEGLDGQDVIFTSLLDDRFGAGGTFDTTSDIDTTRPGAGDWAGIYLNPTATASIDHALIAFGGGLATIGGSFSQFNVLEIHQADARITNSTFESNDAGVGGQAPGDRFGRGPNGEGVIFVRGAQPVIIENDFISNNAPVININANSMIHDLVVDPGRSTGFANVFDGTFDNHGPLILHNALQNNVTNGMLVRGETLTTESIWDDTDIVHVLRDTITIPNLHTFGGLRLESSPTESLVVKLFGDEAGFTATGQPLDIEDRIGGRLHLLGQPGQPVVLTSLSDASVGAGFTPDGKPQNDTDNAFFEVVEIALDPNSNGNLDSTANLFTLDVNLGPEISAIPEAVAAVETAVRFWETLVNDPITVVLDFELEDIGPGLLGGASSDFVSLDFDSVRAEMIADATIEEAIVNDLPTFAQFNADLPNDPADPFSISTSMQLTRANAKALGFDLAAFGGTPSAYDPTVTRDADIVFSNEPGLWDFNRGDGIDAFAYDFVGTAMHEIGHALGFISSTDDVDEAMAFPPGTRSIEVSPLDMFRIAPGTGLVDFTNTPRILDPSEDVQVFFDGGIFDPAGIPIAGLEMGDVPMSTGNFFGDGNQASHWKDDDFTFFFLGLMDPTGTPGEVENITNVDLRAFDLIGWDVVGDAGSVSTIIDNDYFQDVTGYFAIEALDGGSSGTFLGANGSGVTADGETQQFVNENFIFEFLNYIDVGGDGNAVQLGQTTVTSPAQLVAEDVVSSSGTFAGENGDISWQVETSIADGDFTIVNQITFRSDNPLGNLSFINYLDEDVMGTSDDIMFTRGTPGDDDFRVFTLDGPERIGFAQGGVLEQGSGLVNATFDGWAADEFSDVQTAIEGAGGTYSVDGEIDLVDLPEFNDARLGPAYGPDDVTTAFSWTVDPTTNIAVITTFLELVPESPGSLAQAGDWEGILLDQYSHDGNIGVFTELEPTDITSPGTNSIPAQAEFLGALSPSHQEGDENLRLGYTVHGAINDPADVDVYSFTAEAGTEVWIDIDRTTYSLDTVVELIDPLGGVLARSDNSFDESRGITAGVGIAETLEVTSFDTRDFYTSNPRDAGMRLTLPGPEGTVNTYHIRVRSNSDELDANLTGGLTSGVYQLQLRTKNVDQFGGSSIQYADIRYATNAVQVRGLPAHSPLGSEAAESSAPNDSLATAQPLGNLLLGDRVQIDVSGVLSEGDEFDWYQFQIDHARTNDGSRVVLRGAELVTQTAGLTFEAPGVSLIDGTGEVLPQYTLIIPTGAEIGNGETLTIDDGINPSVTYTFVYGAGTAGTTIGITDTMTAVEVANQVLFALNNQASPGPEGVVAEAFTGDPNEPVAVTFDIDYADGFARPDTILSIYSENGSLIYHSRDGRIADDSPAPLEGADIDDLTRGTVGALDPFIGPVMLTPGTYYVAVSSDRFIPTPLDQFVNPNAAVTTTRLGPLPLTNTVFNADQLGFEEIPYHLGDMVLFVSHEVFENGVWQPTLSYVDPLTGDEEVRHPVGGIGDFIGDIDMSRTDEIFGYSLGASDATSGNYRNINTGTGIGTNTGDDGIRTYDAPGAVMQVFNRIVDVNGNGPNGVIAAAGDVVTYEVIINNIGLDDITTLTITDALLQGPNGTLNNPAGPVTLAPGGSIILEGTYTVQQDDIDNDGTTEPDNLQPGYIDNTVRVNSDQIVDATASASAALPGNPAVQIPDPPPYLDDVPDLTDGLLGPDTGVGIQFNAMAFVTTPPTGAEGLIAVGNRGPGGETDGVLLTENLVFRMDPATGVASANPGIPRLGTDAAEMGAIDTGSLGGSITGIVQAGGSLHYAVSDTGGSIRSQSIINSRMYLPRT